MHMPPGYGDALKPGCDIAAIADDIMRFDDYIADVDAHTKNKASVFRITDCKFANAVLEMRSSSNRLDRARKLSQEPVASVVDNAASVLRDCRLDNVRQERGQTCMRSLLVVVHKPRIASHIGGQYRRQPAPDPNWLLLNHRKQSHRDTSYDKSDSGPELQSVTTMRPDSTLVSI